MSLITSMLVPVGVRAQEGWEEVWRLPAIDALPLTQVSGIARDRFGNVLVLESLIGAVAIFDRGGQLVRRLGRQGSGPGEFIRPNRLVVQGDTVVVFDLAQQRYVAFTDDGTLAYTRRMPTPDGLLVAGIRSDQMGGWIGVTTPRITNPTERSGHAVYVLRTPMDGQSTDTLWRFDSGATTWAAPAGLPWGVAPSRFGANGAWTTLDGARLVTADGTTGLVRVTDLATDRLVWSIQLGVVGEPVGERDLRSVRDSLRARRAEAGSAPVSRVAISAPSVWSAADRVLSGGGDTLWVRSPLLSRNAGGAVWFRVTPESVATRQLPGGFVLYAVWADTLVGVVRDDFDVPAITAIRAR